MQDRAEAQARSRRAATSAPARRSPLAGALLLGVDADPGSGPARSPSPRRSPSRCSSSALYLLALRGGAALARRPERHGIDALRGRARARSSSPTSPGATLARNPAARGADPLAPALADPDAARYRLTREARLNGVAAETAADGRSRIVVTRHGRRTPALADRARPSRRAPAASLRDAGVPWLRLDADGRVLEPNAAAAALAGGPPSLDDARRPAAAARRRARARRAPARRCAPWCCPAPTAAATCC